MTSDDVLSVLVWLDAAKVDVWVDGGWGVDALIGEETRPHADLDLALDRDDLERAREALERRGYRHDASAEPGLPARLVMRDADGHAVDLHPLAIDEAGHGWQEHSARERAWGWYAADGLRSEGSIGGRRVRCLSPELQYRFRMGYELSERDEHDVRLLAQRFGLPLPPSTRAS